VEWLLDGSLVSSLDNYTFTSNYTSSGVYNVTVVVSDGLAQDSHEWNLTVLEVYNVNLESKSNESPPLYYNNGSITFASVSYGLPNNVSKPSGSYTVEYIAEDGYVFDHWEIEIITGIITVSDPTDASTTVTVSGDGTLIAVYEATP